ncbi:MAG: glycosyltransferase family 4 protein [Candidatus Aenigmarchaeota archaeon]|nr:glycosyltransferase family 4 protein [Candidatus Aenigmarchaeota archaeon]
MRICFVTTTPAVSIGGVENVAFNIMEQAKKAGFEVENVFAYERYKNPIASLRAYRHVEKKIRNGSFDLVHSHDNASYFLVKNGTRLPVIHTSHGTWGNYFAVMSGFRKRLFSKRSISMERLIVQYADINTSVSNYVKKSVFEQYGVKSRTIYNGVDIEKFNPMGKIHNKIPVGAWVGTNPDLKGLDIAIEAVKMLNLKLIVVGILDKNDNEVIYLGRLPPSQMSIVYKKADFLIFPSKYESHPIAPLEALASGLPLVVSSNSNVEIIKSSREGFVIDGFESENYAEAVQTIIKKWGRMSAAARKCAIKYSWKNQSKKYFRLYEKLV